MQTKDWSGIKCPWGGDEMIDLRIFGGSRKGPNLFGLEASRSSKLLREGAKSRALRRIIILLLYKKL